MINEKKLAANLSYWSSSSESKKIATDFKRLAGGLKNVSAEKLELSTSEQKAIADAISVLSNAAGVYRKAMVIQQKTEKAKQEICTKAAALVKASRFGQLTLAEDKLLLVAAVKPHLLEDIEKEVFSARYAVTDSFQISLEDIAYQVAQIPEQMQERLDAAWQKFQDQRPVLLQRYGERFRKAIALIEGEVAQSVNRV